MPYCPRCGLEVPEDAEACPRCGTEISYRAEPTAPERSGTVEHLRFAVGVIRGQPTVLVPSLVTTLISFASGMVLDSWGVYNEFNEKLMEYFMAQSDLVPAAYAQYGFEFDYTRFIGWIPLLLLGLSLLSWISSLASMRVSWRAMNDETVDVVDGYTYVFRHFTRFLVASIYTVLFTVVYVGLLASLILGSEAIGYGRAMMLMLAVSLGGLVLIFLAAPTYLIMVGDEVTFYPALRSSLAFTRRRLGTYLGITVVLLLINLGLGLVHDVAYYLSFVTGVVSNIAVLDLYTQHKRDSSL